MKILVADYDNTIYLDDDKIIKTIKKIKKLQESGVLFMISTGRSINSILEQINKHHLPFDYLSCADGSIIYDKDCHLIKQYILEFLLLICFLISIKQSILIVIQLF